MTELTVIAKLPFKEVITAVDVVKLHDGGWSSVVITTMNGDIRTLEFDGNDFSSINEVARFEDLAPVAAMGIGDVNGNSTPDFVIAGLDFSLRVISLEGDCLQEIATSSLGTLPTALCVANMTGSEHAEIVVSTNDKALRCYGWYDAALDKLAHKSLQHPVFSMQPLGGEGIPFSRFVFGDDSKKIYIYRYQDDRLHEVASTTAKGSVSLVATGNMIGNRYDEILTITDNNNLSIYGIPQARIELFDNLRSSSAITAARMGGILKKAVSRGQALISHANSNIAILSLDGRRLKPEASIRTDKKAVESLVAFGDIDGDGSVEIIQTVGNTMYVIAIDE